MSKILFFNIPAHGHTNPTLPTVKELKCRGVEVIYYSTEEMKEKIEKTGVEFRPYREKYDFDAEHLGKNVNRMALALMEACDILLPGVIEEVEREKPHLIIHDHMAIWGKLASRILKKPYIASFSTFAFNYGGIFASPHFLMKIARDLLPGFPSIIKFSGLAKKLKNKYKINIDNIFNFYLEPSPLNIVHTSRYFQPMGNSFDERYRFVGPSIEPRRDRGDFPMDDLLDKNKKIIYISLGTFFNRRPRFYQNCLKALGNREETVVMSVGNHINISDLEPIPPNFIIRNHVPQLELLPITSVFISHGGMNSVSEGLYYHVPLIVFPQAAEQDMVADRVAQLGAGIHIRKEKTDAENLRKTVDKILKDDSFYRESKRVGESLKEAGGYKKAADEIMQYINPK